MSTGHYCWECDTPTEYPGLCEDCLEELEYERETGGNL
jgi:predicted amidophosphoribosyltransferase